MKYDESVTADISALVMMLDIVGTHEGLTITYCTGIFNHSKLILYLMNKYICNK